MHTVTKRLLLTVIASALVLAGCVAPPPPVQLINSFDEIEAREMLRPGTNAIKGSALMRQQNGGVVTCAGYTVDLTPATRYAKERMRHLYGNADSGHYFHTHADNFYINQTGEFPPKFVSTAPRYLELRRAATCDAQGFFSFNDVADGVFFVTSGILWYVPVSQYSSNIEGGALMQRVTVHGGEVKEIVLSPKFK